MSVAYENENTLCKLFPWRLTYSHGNLEKLVLGEVLELIDGETVLEQK